MTINRRTKGLIRPLVIAFAFAGTPAVALTSASPATAATCATTTARWGSLPRGLGNQFGTPITNVRAGRNTCFDRMVVDLRGRAPGLSVRYVRQVHTVAEGAVIPLRGGARLELDLRSPDHDLNGRSTYNPRNTRELVNVAGFSTFRQIAYGFSFESHTIIGIGVRARLPMRAFVLNGPGTRSRVVIDVAHRW